VLASSPLVGPEAMSSLAEALSVGGLEVSIPDAPADLGEFTASVAGVVRPDSIVVGYSAAGPRLFTIAEAARPVALVFLDARLPADGVAPDHDPRFAELLDSLAPVDGLLPAWTDWWPSGVMESLLPDERARFALRSACPRVRRSMFSEPIPAPPYSGPCGFIGLGDGYADDAAEARRRHWPTTVIEGAHHLWPIVEPEQSADALVEMFRHVVR